MYSILFIFVYYSSEALYSGKIYENIFLTKLNMASNIFQGQHLIINFEGVRSRCKEEELD